MESSIVDRLSSIRREREELLRELDFALWFIRQQPPEVRALFDAALDEAGIRRTKEDRA